MKEFLLRACVIVRTSNMKTLRCRLTDHIKKLHQKGRCKCSTIIFPHSTNQMRCTCSTIIFPHSTNQIRCTCSTIIFPHSTNQIRCTCSTIIFPHSTNQIIGLWRCRCCCLCRPQILNSLIAWVRVSINSMDCAQFSRQKNCVRKENMFSSRRW